MINKATALQYRTSLCCIHTNC